MPQTNQSLSAIVVVHRGNTRWLGRALRAAQISNPGVEIVLIGDSSGTRLAEELGVRFVEWADHATAAEALAADYVHMSSHGRDFELVCLQRWLILEAWMRSCAQSNIIAIDSDVLIYARLNEILKALCSADAVGFVHDSAHLAWIPNANAIGEICAVIREAYADPDHRLIQKLHYEHLHRSSQGGVSDMSFFQLLARDGSGRVRDIRGPHQEKGWHLDVTMNDGIGGFIMENGYKKIRMIEGIPHAFGSETNNWHPMASLHFQGKAKALMLHYFAVNRSFRSPAISANDRRLCLEKVRRKLCKLSFGAA